MLKKFLRAPAGFRTLGGVCGGLAYALGIPAWIVRLLWFLVSFAYGVGAIAYLLLWVFVPSWKPVPEDFVTRTQP